ncbi:MAG: translation elongation factor Ts [Firmicutes bacterium]|nr:translation elongation factor Ts [Bacillota bacterium]
MAFTAQDVAKLREITGAGMMECKKALIATDGNMEKAGEYLREQGVVTAAKKQSRIASEGAVGAFVCACGCYGALVEVNCESDFVAKGEQFQNLVTGLARHVAEIDPKNVEECLTQPYVLDKSVTVGDVINAATAKIGEKISLRRFARQDNGLQESYLHMGGKIGVLLEVGTDAASEGVSALCHDITLHIAAFGPSYVYNQEVPAAEVEHEKGILKIQIQNDPKAAGKPAMVIEKMIEGKLGKFYKDVCLIDQDFAKDSTKTVRAVVAEFNKQYGANIKINRFVRFVTGEGLEKKNENLADEVAKLSGK